MMNGSVPNRYRFILLYWMILPGLVFFLLFYLVPIAGTIIAWQDFNYIKGVLASKWVGWKHFEAMFVYPEFASIVMNTLSIGFLKLTIGFPFPILIALLLNEVNSLGTRKIFQTIVFMPHLLSWVIVSQIFYGILSPESGIVNNIITALGGKPVFFMAKEEWIQPLIAISHVWKESGYTSVVYLAALSAIEPQLYEAAEIDGASKLHQILFISLPLIIPTIVIMLLISIGQFLETGFDHVYTMLNPLVWGKGDILNTYIYRVGLQQGKYSFTTAVGFFKSLIGFILVMGGNWIAQRTMGQGFFNIELSIRRRKHDKK